MPIHPTAVVHPQAKVHETSTVGPFAVIDSGVELGPGCWVGPQVYLTGQTTIGADNRFYAGCVIGEAPQDLRYGGAATRLRIGQGNSFREHVTVHRSSDLEHETEIGSRCFFMANSHIAHNCHLGDAVILANGVLLGGHVTIAERAFISGNCLIHQFVRVGQLAMMQGGAAISKDLPPFTMARGDNHICGLNTVGIRRAGMSAPDRLALKQLYRLLFRDGKPRRAALEEARQGYSAEPARSLWEFVAQSRRGVCSDFGRGTADEE